MENQETPAEDFSTISEIIDFAKSKFNGQATMTEEDKKERRIGLFTSRKFRAESLIEKKEDGTNDYAKLIEHIKFLEETIKDLKTVHQAYELTRINFVNSASAVERAAIMEEDKKYKPQFAEREAAENVKMTEAEKKIKNLMKLGIKREMAEQIIFGK